MTFDAKFLRRAFGSFCLLAAGAMLAVGETNPPPDANRGAFVDYWLVCFGFAVLALGAAILDLRAVRREARAGQRNLLEDALREIEVEKRRRPTGFPADERERFERLKSATASASLPAARMETFATIATPEEPRESQKAALINLLADEDPTVHQAVREKILSLGPNTRLWLQPHALSSDPRLRRRAQELIRHFDVQAADNAFLAFCLRHGEHFDLEEGAWLLARTQFPEINVEAYQALLDSFVAELRQRVVLYKRANQILGQVNEYLFNELSFTGNEQNYYDPDNSFLNRVLDRRMGNPITLCLLYILIARRLELPVVGVGLPGHFLCRYQSSAEEIYIDAFHHGRQLTKADCIQQLVQGNYDLNDDYLSPASSRRIFQRICRNLHQIYLQLEMPEAATRFQRYLVALGK